MTHSSSDTKGQAVPLGHQYASAPSSVHCPLITSTQQKAHSNRSHSLKSKQEVKVFHLTQVNNTTNLLFFSHLKTITLLSDFFGIFLV